jgi:hypothetical protein
MNTPSPSRWPELFDVAMSIIEQANRDAQIIDGWTFGGGTALMIQIDHRESHDIDLFLDDAQVLPYLNPETQGYDLALMPSSYDTDGVRSLKVAFDDVGEIDFICCTPALNGETIRQEVRGVFVDLETPAEIIAKKVYHRGERLQPRDMFDISAVARSMDEDYLASPLSRFPDKVETALKVVEGFHPDLLKPVLEALNVRPGFEDSRETAQIDTARILRKAMKIAAS